MSTSCITSLYCILLNINQPLFLWHENTKIRTEGFVFLCLIYRIYSLIGFQEIWISCVPEENIFADAVNTTLTSSDVIISYCHYHLKHLLFSPLLESCDPSSCAQITAAIWLKLLVEWTWSRSKSKEAMTLIHKKFSVCVTSSEWRRVHSGFSFSDCWRKLAWSAEMWDMWSSSCLCHNTPSCVCVCALTCCVVTLDAFSMTPSHFLIRVCSEQMSEGVDVPAQSQ